MAINLSSNFLLSAQLSLDDRLVVANAAARLAIPPIQRYEGMPVYEEDTSDTYQLQGGITNGDWVLILPAGGAGDVTGPASSLDNEIVRFDGTTGKIIKDSGAVTLSATGQFSQIVQAGDMTFTTLDATTGNNRGGDFIFDSGNGTGSGDGGNFTVALGVGGGSPAGNGGIFQVTTGNGGGSDANGGNLNLLTGNGTGTGVAGTINLTTGNGGSTSGSGGPMNFTTGNAGGSNGDGGPMTFTTGDGGPANGGNGGSISVNTGTGGGGNSNGGSFSIALGEGSGTGVGGSFTFDAGLGGPTSGAAGGFAFTGGSASGGNAVGGGFVFLGGAGSGTQAGGEFSVTTGNGGATGNSGALTLVTGLGGFSAASGDVTLASGSGNFAGGISGNLSIATGTTSSGFTGSITIQTGASGGSSQSGALTIQTGTASGFASPQNLSILGGQGGASGASGGQVLITGGPAGGTSSGGPVTITGGASTGSNNGASANLVGGVGGSSNGAGGSVSLTGGNAGGGSANGGSVSMVSGNGVGNGQGGDLFVANGTSGTAGEGGAMYFFTGNSGNSGNHNGGNFNVVLGAGNGSGHIGRVAIGPASFSPNYQVELSRDSAATTMGITTFGGSAGHVPSLFFGRGEGSRASSTAITNGDGLGVVGFRGVSTNGADADSLSAYILAQATGNWNGSSYPTWLQFFTTDSGSTSPTMAVTITGSRAVGFNCDDPNYQFEVSKDSAACTVGISAFGGSAGHVPVLFLGRGEGSRTSTQPVTFGDAIASVIFTGVNNAGSDINTVGAIQFLATSLENWTTTAMGSELELSIAGIGTASKSTCMTFNAVRTSMSNRLQFAQGADVGSANDLTLGDDGNVFEITGSTQINDITTTNWQLGSQVVLIFAANPTVKHNSGGGGSTAVILLDGGVDFSASSGDTLTLCYSDQGGTLAWRELAHAVI